MRAIGQYFVVVETMMRAHHFLTALRHSSTRAEHIVKFQRSAPIPFDALNLNAHGRPMSMSFRVIAGLLARGFDTAIVGCENDFDCVSRLLTASTANRQMITTHVRRDCSLLETTEWLDSIKSKLMRTVDVIVVFGAHRLPAASIDALDILRQRSIKPIQCVLVLDAAASRKDLLAADSIASQRFVMVQLSPASVWERRSPSPVLDALGFCLYGAGTVAESRRRFERAQLVAVIAASANKVPAKSANVTSSLRKGAKRVRRLATCQSKWNSVSCA
jgi:hypothetical protein